MPFDAASQRWAEANVVRRRWPGMRVEVVQNTGHGRFVDAPEPFDWVLEGLLATLPEP